MSLAVEPPRSYTLRDAYDRRVWRSVPGVLGREVLVLSTALAGAGIIYDLIGLVQLAGLGVGFGGLLAFGGNLLVNRRRVALLREAPPVTAEMGRPKRVLLLHELFRGRQERTFSLPYTFALPDGSLKRQSILICGCVRDRIKVRTLEPVAYDARTRRSVPLRLAMMVAPHR